MKLYVDGVLQLSATDNSLASGTVGIRTDYVDTYIDDWKAY